MVPPAIYTLPQFGFSDLLSARPGNDCLLTLGRFQSEASGNFLCLSEGRHLCGSFFNDVDHLNHFRLKS